jgi:hypothetical protein
MHRYWWGDEDAPEAARPNFRHPPSGIEVRWYKYIGRGMSADRGQPDDWAAIVAECIAAVG